MGYVPKTRARLRNLEPVADNWSVSTQLPEMSVPLDSLTAGERKLIGRLVLRTIRLRPLQTEAQLRRYGPQGTVFLIAGRIYTGLLAPWVALLGLLLFPLAPNDHPGHLFAIVVGTSFLPGVIRLISASWAGHKFRTRGPVVSA